MAKKIYYKSIDSSSLLGKSEFWEYDDLYEEEDSGTKHVSVGSRRVGISYAYVREKRSSSKYTRIYLAADTYLTIYSVGDDALISPEPTAANTYTFQLIIGKAEDGMWGHETKVCFLNKKITSFDLTDYYYLTSLKADITIPANTLIEYSGSITNSEAENILRNGFALIPTVEAKFSEISDYIDISVTEYGVYKHIDYANVDKSPYIIYSVENLASPGTVDQISPTASSILISNRDNTISWTYTQEFEAPQYYVGITAKYLDTGETQEICRKQIISATSGSVSSYTIPAGTLRSGNVRFTVSAMPYDSAKFYANDDAIWTSGTSVDYTVKGTPEASAVSCDGKPNPTVSWTSSTQAAFQVRFGDFDSGVVAGSETSYTIPKIFDDGNYAVSIRTATPAGEWSEWTEGTYISIINNAPAGTITLKASQFDNNIQLNWESDISGAKYVIYRDGEMIGVTDSTAFIDRFSAGTSEYKIRAVLNGNYSESHSITFDLQLRSDVISIDGGYTYKLLKYTTAPKSQTDLFTDDITYQYYSGREKPIAISSGHVERLKRFSYAFKKRSEALFLRQMRGKAVLIKTTRGCVIYGILGELQMTEAKLTTASFAVRETYREGEDVEYVS